MAPAGSSGSILDFLSRILKMLVTADFALATSGAMVNDCVTAMALVAMHRNTCVAIIISPFSLSRLTQLAKHSNQLNQQRQRREAI